MRRGGVYDRSVRAISVVYLAIGVVILVLTLAGGGGPLSLGMLLGVAFIAVGVARYLLQKRISE
ncbi:MAG: hypothetical protein KDB62_05290 [Solirubrobacterales bacterium]|nr:hypothetical protein [Solirubrobacterales bacterium]